MAVRDGVLLVARGYEVPVIDPLRLHELKLPAGICGDKRDYGPRATPSSSKMPSGSIGPYVVPRRLALARFWRAALSLDERPADSVSESKVLAKIAWDRNIELTDHLYPGQSGQRGVADRELSVERLAIRSHHHQGCMKLCAAKRIIPVRRVAFAGVAKKLLALGHRDAKLQRKPVQNLSWQPDPFQPRMGDWNLRRSSVSRWVDPNGGAWLSLFAALSDPKDNTRRIADIVLMAAKSQRAIELTHDILHLYRFN